MTKATNPAETIETTKNYQERRCFKPISSFNNNRNIEFEIAIKIYANMELQQKITRNFLEDNEMLESSRNNYISWLFMIREKLEFSFETLFSSISILDILLKKIKNEILADQKLFQILSVTCFLISFKFNEKNIIPFHFVEKNFLNFNWKRDEIKKAEIFVLEKIGYQLKHINFL